jgi:hypothetical protein
MNKSQITTKKNGFAGADQVLQYPLPPGGEGGLFAKLQRIRLARRDALNYLMSMPRIYGDISHFQLGQNHSYIVVHPDHIVDESHRRQRPVIQHRRFLAPTAEVNAASFPP